MSMEIYDKHFDHPQKEFPQALISVTLHCAENNIVT